MKDPGDVYRSPLKVYPLVRQVGPRQAGYAGAYVSAYLEGLGWQSEVKELWFNPTGAQSEISWKTPWGVLSVFVQVRPDGRR